MKKKTASMGGFQSVYLIKIIARDVAVLGRPGKKTGGVCAETVNANHAMHNWNLDDTERVAACALPEVREAGKWEAFF